MRKRKNQVFALLNNLVEESPPSTQRLQAELIECGERLVDTNYVSGRTGIPTATLVTWRHRGVGPKFLRLAKSIRYRWPDVAQWLDSRETNAMSDEVEL